MRSIEVDSGGPFLRDSVRGLTDVDYFFTGAEGPSIHAHTAAMERYLNDKSDGDAGRIRAEAELARCRDLVARLLRGAAGSIAFLSNSSDALHRLVDGLDYRPGDNVVTSEIEFPSGVLSLLALRARGVEVRVVPAPDWSVGAADFVAAIDSRTRVVIASHVSYLSGARMDPAALREAAHQVGAVFVLDATQSLGVLRVDADDADAIVASSYKWMLGPHGLGMLHVAEPDLFAARVGGVGWRSVPDLFSPDRFREFHLHPEARRFELGYPSFPSLYLLRESLELLATVGTSRIEQHAMGLSAVLIDRLRSGGFTVLTPRDDERRGTNVSVAVRGATEVAERMLERGVRLWGGDGRVRFSVHAFNTADEVVRGAHALREVTT